MRCHRCCSIKALSDYLFNHVTLKSEITRSSIKISSAAVNIKPIALHFQQNICALQNRTKFIANSKGCLPCYICYSKNALSSVVC